MEKEIIKKFARKQMSDYGVIDAPSLQTYIKNRNEVGKNIDASDLDYSLEEMAFDNEIIILSGKGIQRKYIHKDDYFIMRNIRKTIAIDVDDVLVNLVKEWLARYNHDFEDNLMVDDITDWNISGLVKPECGDKIFNFLEENIYTGIEIIDGAVDGINKLREIGKRVIFVTAGNHPQKESYLQENGFLIDKKDYVFTRDKSLINAGILLDDGYHNVKNFSGIGYLFTRPWNKKFSSWKYRVDTWGEFVNKIIQFDNLYRI